MDVWRNDKSEVGHAKKKKALITTAWDKIVIVFQL